MPCLKDYPKLVNIMLISLNLLIKKLKKNMKGDYFVSLYHGILIKHLLSKDQTF